MKTFLFGFIHLNNNNYNSFDEEISNKTLTTEQNVLTKYHEISPAYNICYLHSVYVFVFDQVKLVLRFSRSILYRRRLPSCLCILVISESVRHSFCFACKYSLVSMACAPNTRDSTKSTRVRQPKNYRSNLVSVCTSFVRVIWRKKKTDCNEAESEQTRSRQMNEHMSLLNNVYQPRA